MRMQVGSQASLSGLGIWRCCELWCRSKRWLGSHVALAVAVAGSLSPDLTTYLAWLFVVKFSNRFFFFFFCFLGSYMQHTEVPRLGVKLELQLLGYATATQDPSHVCDLHHTSWNHQILNPLSEDRGWTCILMDASWAHYHWATTGIPTLDFFIAAGILNLLGV